MNFHVVAVRTPSNSPTAVKEEKVILKINHSESLQRGQYRAKAQRDMMQLVGISTHSLQT